MPSLADVIGQQVRRAVGGAIADAQGVLTTIAVAGGREAAGGVLGDVGRITGILSNLLGDVPIVGGLLDLPLKLVQDVEDEGGRLGRGVGIGYLFGYAAYTILTPYIRILIHAVEDLAQSQIFDPQTAADLAARGIISQDFARSEAGGGGLDGHHEDQLIEGAQQHPDVAMTLAMLNRRLITEANARTALERHGYAPNWISQLLALARTLLSPADIALGLLRGNIDEKTAQGYARQLGIDEQDLQVLLDNTGEPPGAQELLFAYRRQIIDEKRLERGLRQSRLRNEWIDVEKSLRFVPMSTADAIRAAVQSYLTPEQAKHIASQNGLAPRDFEPLLESYGEPISRVEALELYNRGELTRPQLVQAIRESRLKNKYIGSVELLARRLIPYRTISTLVAHGVWPADKAISYLHNLGYTHEDAAALVASATSTKVAQTKHLTQGMTIELFESGAIDEKHATELLGTIGYNHEEAAFVLAAAEAKLALDEQKRAIHAARTGFIAGRTSKLQATQELDALHVPSAQRDRLLEAWAVEKRTLVRELSPAQIAAAVFYGVWGFDEAARKLVTLGYTPNDAKIVLVDRLHEVPKGVHIAPPGP